MTKDVSDWTAADERVLKDACVAGFKSNRYERWPTVRELSVSTGFSVRLICEIADSTHDFTFEGASFPDPKGKLPVDPDIASIAIYSYCKDLDPGHPHYWSKIELAAQGDRETTFRILEHFGFAESRAESGRLFLLLARGRISWTLTVYDALSPDKGLSDGANVLRVEAVHVNGPRVLSRLFLDTTNPRDVAALAHILKVEFNTTDPVKQKPAFEYEIASRKATCFNPFRSQSVLGVRVADRVGWAGVSTASGIYLRSPEQAYGYVYADWRDDLVRKAMGIALRMPEIE